MDKNKNKNRVCHISSLHNRYDIRIFKKECISLSRNNYEVFLIVNDVHQDEIINNVCIRSTKTRKLGLVMRIIYSNRKLINLALETDSDVYHIHDPELLLFYKKLKKNKKKVIFDSHEFYKYQILSKSYIPRIMRKLVSLIYNHIEKKALKNIDAVIYPCTLNGRIPRDNLSVKKCIISNYPIISDFEDHKREKNNGFATYVGSLTEQRGIENIIKACFLANYKLLLAGKFADDGFYKRIANMKEYSCVTYYGTVDSSKIFEVLSLANVGLSTLFNKGQYGMGDTFPTKVFEYMAMGLPSIISKTKYVDDFLAENPFGIAVDPMRVDCIVDALHKLRDNTSLYLFFSRNGRNLVESKYNWELEAIKLKQLYDEILF